jgi:hypothetical protein
VVQLLVVTVALIDDGALTSHCFIPLQCICPRIFLRRNRHTVGVEADGLEEAGSILCICEGAVSYN